MYSIRHISNIAGPPSVTTAVLCLRERGVTCSAKWQCGCRSDGPLQAMAWRPCDLHEIGAALLDEDQTIAVLNRMWGTPANYQRENAQQ